MEELRRLGQVCSNQRRDSLKGADDGVRPPADASAHAHHFTGPRSHRILPGVGHNMPQEVPRVFADAVLGLVAFKTLPDPPLPLRPSGRSATDP